jgi:hypothetical protein
MLGLVQGQISPFSTRLPGAKREFVNHIELTLASSASDRCDGGRR